MRVENKEKFWKNAGLKYLLDLGCDGCDRGGNNMGRNLHKHKEYLYAAMW